MERLFSESIVYTSKYGILPKCNQKIIEYRRVGMLQTIVKSVDVIMFSGSRIHAQMRKSICSTQKLDQEQNKQPKTKNEVKNDGHCQGSLHILNGEKIIHNDQILGENKISKMVHIRANLMGCQEGGHITSFLKSSKM